MPPPLPLPAGHILNERFELADVLGRGGFGIVYLARDLRRDDQAVVKELAPEGSRRMETGVLELHAGALSPERLRQRFLEEARVLTKLNVRGVLPVRAAFIENGTAYYVTEHVQGAETLERVLRREGRLDVAGALDIFFAILEVLEAVHAQGILHRDIKPSNVLLHPSGEVTLIDFGAAREFLSDSVATQTVMYTPGYAPPEQLSERARRGAATDLYALCATLYHMLTGRPPTDAAERVAGVPVDPVELFRPEVDEPTRRALDKGLALRYDERPQTAAELREILAEPPGTEHLDTLAELDRTLVRLQQFRFAKRQCPSCQGVLSEARPLKPGACPVCRRGSIRRRRIEEHLCPICRVGPLRRHENASHLAVCPCCKHGLLSHRKAGLLKGVRTAECPACASRFRQEGETWVEESGGEARPADAWRQGSGRSSEVVGCADCAALFDVLPDGRWRVAHAPKACRFESLYPEEWARVAAGYEPGVGNAECSACGADYHLEGATLTLLDAPTDPHGFASGYLGRVMKVEDARWLAVGKESPNPGLVCEGCGTEFDLDGDYLRLVRSPSRNLVRFVGEPRKLEDWHRLGQGLPTVDQEASLTSRLDEAVRDAYRRGDIGFGAPELAWKGTATRVEDDATGAFEINGLEVRFGGLLRKWRIPVDAVVGCTAEGDAIWLQVSGEREPIGFELAPVTLAVELGSGSRLLQVSAQDLCERLSGRRDSTPA